MSWIEKIKTDLIITTGDGKEYRPTWKNASLEVSYNLSEFNFPNVAGTLVDRGEPMGEKYAIEFYFQGEDNVEVSEAFKASANDNRAWTISHPYYNSIQVHPTSLQFDNSQHNTTRVTGTVIQTITTTEPSAIVSVEDQVAEDKENLDATVAESFSENVTPDASDVGQMGVNANDAYSEGKKLAPTDVANEYFNIFNQSTAAINNATSKPLAAIKAMQNLFNYPAQFQITVENRINLLETQYNKLQETLVNVFTPNEKRLFQSNGNAIVSAMAVAATTPQQGDYENMEDVLIIAETVMDTYDSFIANLDGLQTPTGSSPSSFIPDAPSVLGLSNLINFTISGLYQIALNARQERVLHLEHDSNAIILAHRFYGLDATDSTIQQFINENQIGLNEILQIRKGRKIVYYV